MPVETKYTISPRMTGPGVSPQVREFAQEVDEDVSFSASSTSVSSSSASSESSEST